MSYSPSDLLKTLLETEKTENDKLIEILGLVKPSKGSTSTLNSIIRGLFTKNSKLLALLNESLNSIADSSETEVFKSFINRFIIWFENDGLIIFEKYLSQLPGALSATTTTTTQIKKKFGQPILHCNDYIEFIHYSVNSSFLRNPFIVEKLNKISSQLQYFIDTYKNLSYQQNLNNISFDDVKLFGETEGSKSSRYIKNPSNVDAYQKVSSYFKLTQIVDRSKNENLYMKHKSNKQQPKSTEDIELICLNLAHQFDAGTTSSSSSSSSSSEEDNKKKSNSFDALALLTRPKDESRARSLIYPPFRVNELSISFNRKTNELKFKVINFSSDDEENNQHIVIGGQQDLTEWYGKLKTIFPCKEDFQRPQLIQSKSQISSSGLGINVVSSSGSSIVGENENDKFVYEEPPKSATSNKFKELIDSPTISPLSQLQQQFQKPSVPSFGDESKMSSHGSATSLLLDEYEGDDDDDCDLNSEEIALNLLPPSNAPYQNASHSQISIVSSTISFEKPERPPILTHNSSSSRKSSSSSQQYEQLVKNLTSTSDGTQSHVVRSIKRNTLDMESTTLSTLSAEEERPRSYQAEFVNESDSASIKNYRSDKKAQQKTRANHQVYDKSNQEKFSSVPNLGETQKPKGTMYELNSASAIDISNFGKGYNPSFSIPKGLSDILDESPTKSRKSFFGMFKKKEKKEKAKPKREVQQVEPTKVEEKSVKLPKNLSIETTLNEPLADPTFELPPAMPGAKSRSNSNTASPSTSSPVPAPFALPSSTSMYFFKQHSTTSLNSKSNIKSTSPTKNTKFFPEEEDLQVPQDLKDIINDEETIDFYISPSSPKALILSKWKAKYGKWEMITTNENVFLKIVVNYKLNKSWLVFFKEEIDNDSEDSDVVDKPILLLDLFDDSTTSTKSSALDLQITSNNSITLEKMTVMIRCSNNGLLNEIKSNISNMMGVLGFKSSSKPFGPTPSSIQSPATTNGKSVLSSSTISSIMDNRSVPFNNSSTYSSINSIAHRESSFPKPTQSSYALDTIDDYDHASILNNPENEKHLLLNKMKIRLQKNLESYAEIQNPSSWKILSMNNLSVFMLSDARTNANYYNLVIEGEQNYNWLINTEEKFNVIEKIGKAGMVLKLSESEIFLIECKGKREFKILFDLF